MPETRANNYIKNTSYVPKNNKRVQQKDSNGQFTSALVETNEQTLLETPFTNNKKQKITSETMESSSSKNINTVIENIILTTDNNNQTPSNTEKDDTTKTFDMEIDNVASSASNFTDNVQKIPLQTAKDSIHATKTNNTNESKSSNTTTSSKGKNKQTWSDEMDEAEASTSHSKNAKDRQFNIITAPTRFYATDNAADIKGKSIAEKRNFINALFIHFNGFQGSNYLSKNRKFIIYFDSL